MPSLSAERVTGELETGVPLRFYLAEGRSAWNPASTKTLIWGPCHLTYLRHPDGGIDLKVRDWICPHGQIEALYCEEC